MVLFKKEELSETQRREVAVCPEGRCYGWPPENSLLHAIQLKFLIVLVYIEPLMRLAVYVGGDVICLLRRQATWIRLGHVWLNESSHFPDIVHAGAVVKGVRAP
jgi:hypothetical protein